MPSDKMKYLIPSTLFCALLATPSIVRAQAGVCIEPTPEERRLYPNRAGCGPDPSTQPGGTGTSSSTLSPVVREAARAIGAAIGEELHNALFGNPAEEARQAALIRQQRAAQAEIARLRAIQDNRRREEMFQRLIGSLKLSGATSLVQKGFDGDAGGLTLKGVNVAQSADANALHLKLGDATSPDDALHPAGTLAFEEHRSPVSPAPNTDAMVVDLRNLQHSGFLAQSAGVVSPNDAPLVLDEALGAANGDKSFIAQVPPGFVPPAIDATGLAAFQTANAEYRRANDSNMHLTQVMATAHLRRERADQLAEAAIVDLEAAKAMLTDEATLNRKHELLAAIFADVRARDEALARATAEAEIARAREYQTREEAIRVLRAVTSGTAPATFHPPIPSLVDVDGPTWTKVQTRIEDGWKELDSEGEKIRTALAALKLKVPLKFERMREGVVLGAGNGKAEVIAMDAVRSPFADKTYRRLNEMSELARSKGFDELGGAMIVSFATKTDDATQVAKEGARVLGDHLTDGLLSLRTPEGAEALEKLWGKEFDRLIAHSNGSPIAEALIESGVIKVNELNIVGGDRSLLNGHRLQKLLEEGKVKRIVVWVNVNDPVVWGSSIDQLRFYERTATALEHIARKVTGDIASGDTRVQYRFMVGDAPSKGDLFAQHRIETAYYPNIAKYFHQ